MAAASFRKATRQLADLLPLDAGTVCATSYWLSGLLFRYRSRTLTVAHLASRFGAVLQSLAQEGRRGLIANDVDCQAVLRTRITPGDIAAVKNALPV